jgi:hypothetical protein
VKYIPAKCINVDLDLKSTANPSPLLEAWSDRVYWPDIDEDLTVDDLLEGPCAR